MTPQTQSAPATAGAINRGELVESCRDTGVTGGEVQDNFHAVDTIQPTPENWEIYNRPEADDQFPALVESVRKHGVLEAITISEDGFILSGHRRHAAAVEAGLQYVSVRVAKGVWMADADREERTRQLIRHNRGSRVKTTTEAIAESVAEMNPDEALAIVKARKTQVHDKTETFGQRVAAGTGRSRRTDPLKQRGEFFAAVLAVLEQLRNRGFLPTSVRHVHYNLLEKRPMTSKGKKGHPYGSDKRDSGKLSDLITDARSAGLIPDSWFTDATRPTSVIRTHKALGDYVAEEVGNLFMHHFGNIHRDQPSHVELVVEKNTIFPLLKKHVAHELRIPITSMRGFGSYPVSCQIRDRFIESGKDKLVIVYASDLDPEGVCMPESFAKYFMEDHGIEPHVIRAAVTMDQVKEHGLPPDIDAKPTSSRYKRYVERFGNQCWELDALDPELLIKLVDDACRSCLDIDLLNAALKREDETDIKLARLNQAVTQMIPALAKSILGEDAA